MKKIISLFSIAAYVALSYTFYPHEAPSREQILAKNIHDQKRVNSILGLSNATIQKKDAEHVVVHVPMANKAKYYQENGNPSDFYYAGRELSVCLDGAPVACQDTSEYYVAVGPRAAASTRYKGAQQPEVMTLVEHGITRGSDLKKYEANQIASIRGMLRAPKPH